jgi:uncharacterized protein YkwD
MSLRGMTTCLLVVCILLVGPPGERALASPSRMVDKINTVRAQHGLKALSYSRSLSRSSGRYARYMVSRQNFSHAPRIRASSRFSRLGEILAWTPGPVPNWEQTLSEWLASPSHRAVLLSRKFSVIGAGRAHNPADGDEAAVVWAVQFGRR